MIYAARCNTCGRNWPLSMMDSANRRLCRPCKRAASRRWKQSPAAKAARKQYEQCQDAKAKKREYDAKYNKKYRTHKRRNERRRTMIRAFKRNGLTWQGMEEEG